MSKVDMKVFEETKELLQYKDMSEMVYNMCEADLCTSNGHDAVYPSWDLYETDKDEYYRQQSIYQELDEKFTTDVLQYKNLEQEGGGEGGSEYCYGVFSLKGKIYKAEYCYYSYNGHAYDYIVDTLQEVKPEERTITVYVPV